ncbi:hypothetical protein [Mameliella alba]|uniref:Uncharacterized protein n=1 Tax=Mameliella alba TaxID=561184 RepID=A0A0B3RWZ7_9RHOB|nr:hypothetical protein [Mameliella alba]KHQ51268.1 hypothetical protein OA50_04301 [Mameliella alba]
MFVKTQQDIEKNGTLYFKNKDKNETAVLACKSCAAPLVEGYVEGCLIGVKMRCPNCSTVNATPLPSPGDILQPSRVGYFEGEEYRLGGIVEISTQVSLISDKAVDDILNKVRPRQPTNLKHHRQGILHRYCQLTGRAESDLRSRLSRFKAQKRSGFLEEPLIWSVENAAKTNYDMNKAVALSILDYTTHMDQAWRHHPRYEEFAREMLGSGDSFFHTIFSFHVAEMLFSEKNNISFLEEGKGKNPDLFLKYDARSKLFIEVKFPRTLTWSPDSRPKSNPSAYISKVMSKNKQICEANNGFFAFGLLNFTKAEQEGFLRAVQSYLRSGNRKRFCLGVYILSLGERIPGRLINTTRRIAYIKNPGYRGWAK